MTNSSPLKPESCITFAQITDCHLFANKTSLHFGSNVFENLKATLQHLSQNQAIKFVIFTGDLTQDHSEESYQVFVDCLHECEMTIPVYFVAGNHDEPSLMAKYFTDSPFKSDITINTLNWQIQLLNSKSDTPAGYINSAELANMSARIDSSKYQFLMLHHHPIDVGYFIDKHGLENKTEFWRFIDQYDNMQGIACGHVHGAMTLIHTKPPQLDKSLSLTNDGRKKVPLFTCPATSIQFDPRSDGVSALSLAPGYRTFTLYQSGSLETDVHWLPR